MAEFTHFDKDGAAHMVDVSDKAVTSRIATAKGRIYMGAETLKMVMQGTAKKRRRAGRGTPCRYHGGQKNPRLDPPVPPAADHQSGGGFGAECR